MNESSLVNIIVPAYNEELRIGTSLRTLVHYLRESEFPYPYTITVVNNGSSDNTEARVAQFIEEYPEIVVCISLTEKGKGRAIRRGWEEPGAAMVFMDADLSSDLAFLAPLVDAIMHEGNDVAIGSRLGAHSEIRGRRTMRSLASHVYNAIIRFLFRTGIADHQCGFKAIRKDAYKRIAPLLEDTGWFFDTELLVVAARHGYSIRSIDIRWSDNQQSKVSLTGTTYDMAKAIYSFQKRLYRVTDISVSNDRGLVLVGQVIRFLVSGVVAAVANVGLFWILFTFLHVQYLLDVVFTSIVVFFVSFSLQKFWTFDDRGTHSLQRQLPLYALSAIATTLANLALIFILVGGLHLWPVLAQVIALALIAIVNFFVYKFLIFRR